MSETLARLAATISARRDCAPETSYVAKLLASGTPHVARKFGEEAIEAIVAALGSDKSSLVGEAADVLFHLLVLLEARGVAYEDVLAELERRDGISGIAEKAARRE